MDIQERIRLYKQKNTDITLSIIQSDDLPLIAKLCEALGNETRLKIIKLLQKSPFIRSVPQLVKELSIPKTTLMHHLTKLEEVNILSIFYKSSRHATVRYIGRDLRSLHVTLYCNEEEQTMQTFSEVQSLGVGQFTDFSGIALSFATKKELFRLITDCCFIPQRFDAGLVYANFGKITYYFNNNTAKQYRITELNLSLEICSEAPYFDNEQKSDITFWINRQEIATYRSEGDYGDRRGKLNPEWWPNINSQYGKLLVLTIREECVLLNGELATSKVRLSDLALQNGNKIVVTLGNKDTAEYPNGFNLFGKDFGDFAQDICLELKYNNAVTAPKAEKHEN